MSTPAARTATAATAVARRAVALRMEAQGLRSRKEALRRAPREYLAAVLDVQREVRGGDLALWREEAEEACDWRTLSAAWSDFHAGRVTGAEEAIMGLFLGAGSPRIERGTRALWRALARRRARRALQTKSAPTLSVSIGEALSR